jgi:type IV pilus assembly protein PilA
VVVIIGILAAIAIPKFANTKDKAKIASMKSDLRNFVSAQEGHFADYATYATAHDITAGCVPAAATVCFAPTIGNVMAIGVATAGGFNATVTNASLATPKTCGVFGGNAAAPNAAVVQEGAPACW